MPSHKSDSVPDSKEEEELARHPELNDMPATRIWFTSGKIPQDSDFVGNPMACEFASLWEAVEDAGDIIIKENRPVGLDPWIKCGPALLGENMILSRYQNSIGRPRAHRS
ncbi:MAG: hypothetical protein WAV18_04545 [Roseiarcus sp.]